ncbi:Putative aliphatic sulfonates transport permease protein SsuC [Thalassovita autumnalis]|uniref:Aliphatic sulfonates transport permease protein SsuC n=1 Tax=Thalassovita autumnalis TaxID=2072972 RepID=A0A0P1FYE2_9RHOB|nr:ABC transporter permease [Thalassovita autumnalis]CUH68766.1 Putative aliphatic sulfonates transport permease protein SsuC [Thalassovita autumnalis]CUH74057.1 Putative aliphatic sulfonates transport permease protein SsuC [Thalassovita autumnalis]
MRSLLPIFTVVAAIFVIWYGAAVALNTPWAKDQAKRNNVELSFTELVADTWSQKKPKLPAPHQVVAEIWKTTGEMVAKGRAFSKRSLIYHSWITLSATMLGFVMGTGFGILLAIGIVYNRVMDMSVMPWVIASQTIPILAVAPMIIVVLNAVGISGLLPKAMISMYLSFFPVVVGMVKGLRSPDQMQLDQMRTWNATSGQEFWRLRLPSSMPFLFASLKVAMAASLVGAIVGELPTGAVAGLGARLLAGSYYGQTIQIWSALIMAAALAAALVALIGLIQRMTLKKMGMVQ